MAILTVRNVPDEVHRALRLRAAEHGRSTEAEVREILESAVKSEAHPHGRCVGGAWPPRRADKRRLRGVGPGARQGAGRTDEV